MRRRTLGYNCLSRILFARLFYRAKARPKDLFAFLITGISLFRQSHLLTSGRIPLERYPRPPARPLSSWGTIGPGRGVNLHTQIPTIDLERRERRRLRIAGRTRVCLQQWAYPFGCPWPGASLKEGQ